jgi:hypothetical protein
MDVFVDCRRIVVYGSLLPSVAKSLSRLRMFLSSSNTALSVPPH